MKFLWLALAALLTASCTDAQKTFEVLWRTTKDFVYWQERCKQEGGRLASINSEEEQAAAQAAMKATSKTSALTGMKRIRPHEFFINGDGELLPYTNWKEREPNDNQNGEECVEISNVHNYFGKWSDILCKSNAALCEFDPSPKSFEALQSSSLKSAVELDHLCRIKGGRLAFTLNSAEKVLAENALKDLMGNQKPCADVINILIDEMKDRTACNGRVALCEFAPKTYSLVRDLGRALSFEQWRAKCQARGAQLGRINNAEEQRYAFRVIKTSQEQTVLIDSRRKYRGSPIFVNSDGETIPYSNWNDGEPNNQGGNQSCTQVWAKGWEWEASKWDDTGCNNVKAALCESRKFVRNIHYFILKENSVLTYNKWAKRCQEKNGHLASIRNEEEQALAEKALRTTNIAEILTGMKRKSAHSKIFVDSHGRMLSYSHWSANEPNDIHGEDCIELYNTHSFGRWNDVECSKNTAALCEKS